MANVSIQIPTRASPNSLRKDNLRSPGLKKIKDIPKIIIIFYNIHHLSSLNEYFKIQIRNQN